MSLRLAASSCGRVLRTPRLVVVVSVALFVALALWGVRAGDTLTFHDERDYDAIARALLEGRGFSSPAGPTAFRAPAQPALLALVYATFGPDVRAARVAQALLASALPLAATWFSRPILEHPGRANLVGLACALHPGLFYAATTVYPVPLTALSLVVGVGLASRSVEGGGLARAAGGGLALSVAGLATPYLAPVALAATALLAARRRFACAALLAATAFAPIGAWALRNHDVLGAAVIGTHGGYNLALGANDQATVWSGNTIEPELRRSEVPDDEILRDAAYRASAMSWIRRHPAEWAALATGRALAILESTGRPATQGAPRGFAVALAGVGLAAWVGLGLVGRLRARLVTEARLALIALLLVAGSAAATIAKPRFRFPCDPLLATFAVALLPRRARFFGADAEGADPRPERRPVEARPPGSATPRDGTKNTRLFFLR